jgi:hypothetical protein
MNDMHSRLDRKRAHRIVETKTHDAVDDASGTAVPRD